MHRKQLVVLFIMLAVYALATFIGYAFFLEEMTNLPGVTPPTIKGDPPTLGLSTAGVVFLLYAVFGLAGYWFVRKLGLPGIYSPDGNWLRWALIPFGLGIGSGVLLVLGDIFFARFNGLGSFPHPAFPASIFASVGAGIGEEIIFRGFVFGLWALVLNWLLSRFHGRTSALWIANFIAALAFGASHLGLIFLLTGARSIAEINPVLLVEVFLLNGVIGLVAGQRYMQDGLVAASGVHFWTDIVFHVIWGALS